MRSSAMSKLKELASCEVLVKLTGQLEPGTLPGGKSFRKSMSSDSPAAKRGLIWTMLRIC